MNIKNEQNGMKKGKVQRNKNTVGKTGGGKKNNRISQMPRRPQNAVKLHPCGKKIACNRDIQIGVIQETDTRNRILCPLATYYLLVFRKKVSP